MSDISIDIVFRILFRSLSNADLEFGAKKFTWRSYITAKTLLIVKKIELINKDKFVEVEIDGNSDTFIVYITILKALK